MQEAFKLQTAGQHFTAKVGGKTYTDVLITKLDIASDRAATVTLMLPTLVGARNRVGRWRLDQVEVV
jgi:hypothetical protein